MVTGFHRLVSAVSTPRNAGAVPLHRPRGTPRSSLSYPSDVDDLSACGGRGRVRGHCGEIGAHAMLRVLPCPDDNLLWSPVSSHTRFRFRHCVLASLCDYSRPCLARLRSRRGRDVRRVISYSRTGGGSQSPSSPDANPPQRPGRFGQLPPPPPAHPVVFSALRSPR